MRRTRSSKRFPNVHKIGNSSIVPYIKSESWKERHERRKQIALDNQDKVKQWCDKYKWTFRIANEGHHWIFTTSKNKMIEWFPSTGKLAIGKKWREGIHCHDYQQLIKVFEATL